MNSRAPVSALARRGRTAGAARVLNGKKNPHRSSLSRCAPHLDLAAVFFDGLAGDGETQARAGILRRKVGLEDLLN